MKDVYVCRAGSCRRKGADAVLLEIEELANAVDNKCQVKSSGCLGLCNQAPNAVVVSRSMTSPEKYHTRIDSLAKSAAVVHSATGTQPPMDDPGIQTRLAGVRSMREREHAISVFAWNDALKAVANQIAHDNSDPGDMGAYYALVRAQQELFSRAGFPNGGPPKGRSPEAEEMPSEVDGYSQWTLDNVTKVSRHSAVFHFVSRDRKRGTPNPRGAGRAPPMPKTWHTTLLAEVGPTSEGPLPWVERDYTPISTAKEWETGRCAILIKIYKGHGVATSWLYDRISQDKAEPLKVWLSRPMETLRVPSLTTSSASDFNPRSVLLLLAGTGVVALPQILQHRDPYGKLGISTRKQHQLHVPVDLILSCRRDDVLMLQEITQLCQEAHEFSTSNPGTEVTKGVRHVSLLLTGSAPQESYPFPDISGLSDSAKETETGLEKLERLPNARVLRTRLTQDLISEAMSRMPQPCRVLVSGPTGFNAAVRGMLLSVNVDEEAITILEA